MELQEQLNYYRGILLQKLVRLQEKEELLIFSKDQKEWNYEALARSTP